MALIDSPPETPLVIDTDIFSHLRNQQPYVEREIIRYYSNTKSFPAITSMTIFEANYGINDQFAKKVISEEKADQFRKNINTSLNNISQILPFDQRAAEIAGYIYPQLLLNESAWLRKRKSKKKKGNREKYIWQDVFIISTTLSNNYGFATQNIEDAEIIARYLPPNLDLRLAIWKS